MKLMTSVLVALLLMAGCTSDSDEQQKASQHLQNIFNEYYVDDLKRNPISATYLGETEYNGQYSRPISEQAKAESLAFHYDYIERLQSVNSAVLSVQDKLSYDVFMHDREVAIGLSDYPSEMLPISQLFSDQTLFAVLGSGDSVQPFETELDYDNFIARANGFAAYMESAKQAMEKGIETGVVLPKALAEKMLPQFATHAMTPLEESVFYGPVNKLKDANGMSQQQKNAIAARYTQMIAEVIIPTYQNMHDFIKNDYLPNTRLTSGYGDLPNGKNWYQQLIQLHTTLPLSADELHEFGLKEVSRIRTEMNLVRLKVGFDGDLQAFFEHLKTDDQFYFDSEEALIAAYENVKADINARVPALFEVFPKADYQVKAVEAFRAASAPGASYQAPAPDGSRPGIFYINSYNLKSQPNFIVETLSIHEASPGHHFQISIQQELEGLPKFRLFGGYTVFAEGWALYAESLGKQLGLFTDPYQWYGRLSDEQLRAMRLVVDTGLHAKGWTREQAIEYMKYNSSLADTDIVSEVERYMAMPGQALSYKVGQREIERMLGDMKQAMGNKFDIRKFHTQVLVDGSLPMPILEQKLTQWANQQ